VCEEAGNSMPYYRDPGDWSSMWLDNENAYAYTSN
jgi:hypothetical protein